MWGGFPGSMYIWYMVSTCGFSVADEEHGRSSSLAHPKTPEYHLPWPSLQYPNRLSSIVPIKLNN